MIGPQPPPDEEALIAFIRDYIDQLSEPNREILTKVISELARRLFGRRPGKLRKGEIMGYYYYKDGEKIGPVDSIEFDNLLEWGGDIKPDTIIEWPNGKQLPASEHSSPPGSNPLNISLETARRLAPICSCLKWGTLFVFFISFAAEIAAAISRHNELFGVPWNTWSAIAIIAIATSITVGIFAHVTKLSKVPPKPKED